MTAYTQKNGAHAADVTENQDLEEAVTEINMNINIQTIGQTGWTSAVPDEYFVPTSKQGSIVSLDYATKDCDCQ